MRRIVLIIALFFSLLSTAQNKVPNVYLENLDSEKVNIQNFTKRDNVTVLSFWATWCMPCLKELDAISEVYPQWQEETGVELIAISTDDARTIRRVKPLVNGKKWDYTVLLDRNQELKRRFNITSIPHVVVVKNNEIIYRHSGYVPGGEKELYKIIQENAE